MVRSMNSPIKSKHSRDILNELKWKGMDLNECSIQYIHRGVPGDTKTVSGEDIIDIGRSFITLYPDTMIPYHRILIIKYKGTILYMKKAPE